MIFNIRKVEYNVDFKWCLETMRVSACKGLLVTTELKIRHLWFQSFFKHLSSWKSSICFFKHLCNKLVRLHSSMCCCKTFNESHIFKFTQISNWSHFQLMLAAPLYIFRKIGDKLFEILQTWLLVTSSDSPCPLSLSWEFAPFLWAALRIPNNRPLWPPCPPHQLICHHFHLSHFSK